MNRTRIIFITLLILFSTNISIAYNGVKTPVVFYDNTFDDSDWELFVETFGNGGTVSVNQSIDISDPNIGQYRRIINTVNSASNVFGFHKRIGAVYNPQIDGAISSIYYTENSIMFSGYGEGQATGAALIQDGIIYYGVRLLSYHISWTSQSICCLQADDFAPAPWRNLFQHPDFSSNGSPIVFGFWRGNSSRLGGYTIDAGIDNWSVTVNSLVCMLLGDLNNDCKVDFSDFVLMAQNWLIDCHVTPANSACN